MRRRIVILASLALGVASAACSAILGLDAPPAQGQDASTGSDATAGNDSAVPDDSGTASEAGPSSCPALDGGAGYYPFTQLPIDDAGNTTWEFFDPSGDAGIANFGAAPNYTGGAFDGRYVYFAGTNHWVARYDTHGQGFSDPAAWAGSFLPDASDGFAGAVFDGRYVTFVPGRRATAPAAVAARYDTQLPGDFSPGSSVAWDYFDVSTLAADGGAATYGFIGGVFDGRYIYFVPHEDSAPFGRVVRYDTAGTLDAGLSGDAGSSPEAGGAVADAGADASHDGGHDSGSVEPDAGFDAGIDAGPVPPGFTNPSQWSTFDVSTTNPAAAGFAGGVFAAGDLYLVPSQNGAYDAAVNSGYSSTVLRYPTDASFTAPGSWTAFDMSRINGDVSNFFGGVFDGRFVYFVPRGGGIATRFDTTESYGSNASWASYDTTRNVPLFDASPNPVAAGFTGGAFDGRFVYLIPADTSGQSGSPVVRYDTSGSFGASCAWSTFDPSQLPVPGGGHVGTTYEGAVFDGQYLYLIPNGATGTVFVRFAAKVQAPSPNPPVFNNSFL